MYNLRYKFTKVSFLFNLNVQKLFILQCRTSVYRSEFEDSSVPLSHGERNYKYKVFSTKVSRGTFCKDPSFDRSPSNLKSF